MMISGVIFDMDGLLLDSEVYWAEARAGFCLSHGCHWTAEDENSVKGHNSREWAAVIRGRCALQLDPDKIISDTIKRMEALYRHHLPLLPGAVSAVTVLEGDYPLGVASSSPSTLIEFALEEAGIRAHFGTLVSADEAGKGKPAPDVFLLTADRMGKDPSTLVVFEDSTAGIRAARAAGMRVIAVPNPHYPPAPDALHLADLILTSLVEFSPSMLTKLAQ